MVFASRKMAKFDSNLIFHDDLILVLVTMGLKFSFHVFQNEYF